MATGPILHVIAGVNGAGNTSCYRYFLGRMTPGAEFVSTDERARERWPGHEDEHVVEAAGLAAARGEELRKLPGSGRDHFEVSTRQRVAVQLRTVDADVDDTRWESSQDPNAGSECGAGGPISSAVLRSSNASVGTRGEDEG